MLTLSKTRISEIPISCHFTKNPQELKSYEGTLGVDLTGYDFVFVSEDDLGNPLKLWAARFEGDRSWVLRWQDEAFDYDLWQEADLLWEKR